MDEAKWQEMRERCYAARDGPHIYTRHHCQALADLSVALDDREALRAALARCDCWNRWMAGRALADTNTCKDVAKYLADCGREWCPPCLARALLEVG